jgi:hypothetical protein
MRVADREQRAHRVYGHEQRGAGLHHGPRFREDSRGVLASPPSRPHS